LPPRLRVALKVFIETGDLWRASRLAGMKLEEFDELRRKAGIWNA
jgi:predicted HTH domain antitoxin